MLGARQLGGELVVFAFLWIDRVDLAEREASLVQTRSRSLARRADAVELRRRILRLGERLLIRAERGSDIGSRPCIQHAQMLRRLHQALMLVLTAQIDHGRDGARQLPHARHAAVEGDARAAVRRHASDGDQLVRRCIEVIAGANILRAEPGSSDIGCAL